MKKAEVQMIEKKKNFNFRKGNVYHKLYKTENFGYYMMNFVIMNMPLLGKSIFALRYKILKILKKR